MRIMTRLGVALLGLALATVFACFIFQDVQTTITQSVQKPEAMKLAAANLAALVPENGWFESPRQPIFSFENSLEGWTAEPGFPSALPTPDLPPAPPGSAPQPGGDLNLAQLSSAHASHGSQSLAIPVSFPDPATAVVSWDRPSKVEHLDVVLPPRGALERIPEGLRGVRYLAYDIFVPAEAEGFIGCLYFLKDKDGRWYQARSRTTLIPGTWTTLTADIRGGSPDVEPLGHLGQWDENQASQIRTLGITVYGDRTFKGFVWIDRIRGWMRAERYVKAASVAATAAGEAGVTGTSAPTTPPDREELLRKAKAFKAEAPLILNLRTDPPQAAEGTAGDPGSPPCVERYESFRVSFELNRDVYNPFDPDEANVIARIKTPSGKTIQTFGFWSQDFERQPNFANDTLLPTGHPHWEIRFTPREEGPHSLSFQVLLEQGSASVSSPEIPFHVIPSRRGGFVKASQKDPSFWELDDGSFFYPIGHNIHSPIDFRCWDRVFHKEPPLVRGLSMYEDFLPKMAAAGENVGEVWMSSWWLGIEWTNAWPDYHGLGRYSLERAWKLDQLLELAAREGIRIHLVLDNHGKFSQWCDWEWDLNPYNRNCDGNGPVLTPSEYFTNAKCRKLHKQRLRYIATRWGPHPSILGWELVSEMDLVGDGRPPQNPSHPAGRGYYKTEEPRAWVREMLSALKEYDAYDHPVTNHYATDYKLVDLELASTPLFDYIVCDAYRAEPDFTLIAQRTDAFLHSIRKPYWITEFGGDWNATSIPRLVADVHAGLWATWMTRASGTPLFWWYDMVDQRNLYTHYRAFANYARGEDRRGLNGTPQPVQPARQDGNLSGLAYLWANGAYVWIYDRRAMREWPEDGRLPLHQGVEFTLLGLAPGRYHIEFWDTASGQVLVSQATEPQATGSLVLTCPDFKGDLAVKVRPAAPRP